MLGSKSFWLSPERNLNQLRHLAGGTSGKMIESDLAFTLFVFNF